MGLNLNINLKNNILMKCTGLQENDLTKLSKLCKAVYPASVI
jgi:hypothetical protein